jgi:hypothetical protein
LIGPCGREGWRTSTAAARQPAAGCGWTPGVCEPAAGGVSFHAKAPTHELHLTLFAGEGCAAAARLRVGHGQHLFERMLLLP